MFDIFMLLKHILVLSNIYEIANEKLYSYICCIQFNYDIILLLSYIYICGHNITY